MSTTVVDKLIVEFGLDPRQFKQGLKEANLAIVSTKENTTRGANEMVASLRRVAAEFVSLFLAVKSIREVVGVFKDLNESTRQLGYTSRNTDESAAALQNWGNIAEIVGGKAEDATSTFMGLQKAIFDVGHGLGWSDQLTEFGRIGVDTGVGQGKVRNAHDLLRDTTIALEQQFPDKASRFQETQVLGLQGGIANLVAGGLKDFDRQWKQQLGIPQVTQNDTKQAQNLSESWAVLKQRIEAELRKVLTAVSPALQKLFRGIGDFIAQHSGEITRGIQELLGWFSGPGPQRFVDGMTYAAQAVWDFAKAVVAGKDVILHPFKNAGSVLSGIGDIAHNSNQAQRAAQEEYDAETKFNIPHGTLAGSILPLPAHGQPGQAAQIAQYLSEAHADDDADWTNAVDTVRQQFNMTNVGPIGDAAQAAQGAVTSPKAVSALAGKPTAFNSSSPGGTTTVSIGEVSVYTQATDATGIAGDLSAALNRKLTVSLVDRGLA